MTTRCKTCDDSKMVYVVCYRRLSPPHVPVEEGTEPTPVSYAIEQVLVFCPDCNRIELRTEPGPAI